MLIYLVGVPPVVAHNPTKPPVVALVICKSVPLIEKVDLFDAPILIPVSLLIFKLPDALFVPVVLKNCDDVNPLK